MSNTLQAMKDVQHNGSTVDAAVRSKINFIDGAGGTMTVTDNAGADRVDVTLNSGVTYRKTTVKAVTNTVSETDLLNGEIQIAANAMGATGKARGIARGDWVTNTGASTAFPRFKLKLGAGPTVVLDTGATTPADAFQTATRYPWVLRFEIQNTATNAQNVHLELSILAQVTSTGSVVAFPTGTGQYFAVGTSLSAGLAVAEGINTSAIDTTAAMNVLLTVINPTATATCETKLWDATVEIF